jgi:hypothetical protein
MSRKPWDFPTGRVTNYDPETGTTSHYDQAADGTATNGAVDSDANTKRDRFRSLGEAAANMPGFKVDFGLAHADRVNNMQSRGQQLHAAELYGQAATGHAPSRAAIMGNQVAGQSLEQAMAAQAGAKTFATRGSMGMAAAGARAMQAQAAMQQQGVGQFSGMREGELGDARGGYFNTMTNVRAGDYTNMAHSQDETETNADAENAIRGIRQRGQMGNEQLGINAEQAQIDSEIRRMAIQARENETANANFDARDARAKQLGVGLTMAVATAGASAAAGGAPATDPKKAGSDERMKHGVVPLYEDAGSGVERHWDADVARARPDVTPGASLSGPTPKYGAGLAATAAKMELSAAPKQRKLTAAELNRMADEMLGRQRVQSEAQLGAGPATAAAAKRDPMTEALATGLAPHSYEYKPEFAAAEGQKPGEKNVGPMAQAMAGNPVTGGVVQEGPDGMLRLDMKKATKLSLAAAGHNARKLQEMQAQIDALKGGR